MIETMAGQDGDRKTDREGVENIEINIEL